MNADLLVGHLLYSSTALVGLGGAAFAWRRSRALALALLAWGAADALLVAGNFASSLRAAQACFALHDALVATIPFALVAFLVPRRRALDAALVVGAVVFALVRLHAFAPAGARELLHLPPAPSPTSRSWLAVVAGLDVVALPLALIALEAWRRRDAWPTVLVAAWGIDHAARAVASWRLPDVDGGFLVAAIVSRVADFAALAILVVVFVLVDRSTRTDRLARRVFAGLVVALVVGLLDASAFGARFEATRVAALAITGASTLALLAGLALLARGYAR